MTSQAILTIISIAVNLLLVVGGIVFFFGGEKRSLQHLDSSIKKLDEGWNKRMELFEGRVEARFSKIDGGVEELKKSVSRDRQQMQLRHNRLFAQYVELRTHVKILNQRSGGPELGLMELTEVKENDES